MRDILSSRIFWKIFLSFAGLILGVSILFSLVLSYRQASEVETHVRSRLRESAILLRNSIEPRLTGDFSDEAQAELVELEKQTKIRFTLIDHQGKVFADSQKQTLAEVRKMESHHDRKELMAALKTGEAFATRFSPTFKESYLYYACQVKQGDQVLGVVRSALPVSVMKIDISAAQRLVWLVAMVAGVSVLALSSWFVAQMIKPVLELKNAAEAVALGDYTQRIRTSGQDEIGMLAQSFNKMCKVLEKQDARLDRTGQRQEAILEGMSEGVIAVNAEGNVRFANSAAGRLFDFNSKEVRNRSFLEIVRSYEMNDMVIRTLEKVRPQTLEITWTQGSEQLKFGVRANPLSGVPVAGVVLVIQDLTEIRRLESLRQEFVANVSHELKTPLASIKAYAETLQEGAVEDPKFREKFLKRIGEQADHLDALIQDTLSLARIEAGNQVFDIRPVLVSKVVESCVDDYQQMAERKGIQLQIVASDDPLLLVEADKGGLREILNNLVSNAIKYTPSGGTVTTSWQQQGENVTLKVQDTGIGIGAEHHARLFERFYRIDKARSRDVGGTGLGLSIVKHLAQAFGGQVSLESQIGVGSTFLVTLKAVLKAEM